LYKIAVEVGRFLRANDLYFIENTFKNVGKSLLSVGASEISATEDDIKMKCSLYKDYEREFRRIKEMGLVDITRWEQEREMIFDSTMQV
jgi:hypothetical protein